MDKKPNQKQFKKMFEKIMAQLDQGAEKKDADLDILAELPTGNGCSSGHKKQKLSLFVLGKTRIEHGGIEVGFGGQYDTVRLLCLLASRLGRPMHIEDVKESLWPEIDPDRAEVRLMEAVSHLCNVLDLTPDQCPIDRSRSQLSLRLGEDVWLDAVELIEATGSDDSEQRRCALTMYRDEPFADFPFEGWTLLPRELLRSKFVQLTRLEATSAASDGQIERSVNLLEWALEAEPYDEEIYCDAIASNIELGRFSTAVKQSLECRDQLANIGLAPSTRFEALEQRLEPYFASAQKRFA